MVWNKRRQLSKKKKLIFILAVILIIGALFFSRHILWPATSEDARAQIMINQQTFQVEIAADPASQYQGLSNRPNLCLDCGMLFVFTDREEREFVMRNMRFPLDIIFIDQGRIRKIAANLAPEGADVKNIYASDGPADWVLEINGGLAQKNNFQVGDQIFLNK